MREDKNIQILSSILRDVGFDFSQLTDVWRVRAPYVIAVVGGLQPDSKLLELNFWGSTTPHLIGSRDIISILSNAWGDELSRGSYDSLRRELVVHLVNSGIVTKNPDNPLRAPNSPSTCYAVSNLFGRLCQRWGLAEYEELASRLKRTLDTVDALSAADRSLNSIYIKLPCGPMIQMEPGDHNLLQKRCIENFAHHFLNEPKVLYIGDSTQRLLYLEKSRLSELNIIIDAHQELPDIIIEDVDRGWVVIIEAVTSSGHIGESRKSLFLRRFSSIKDQLVFVTAFPDMALFAKFASSISWETEVWIADRPTHLIHYNGDRFLGPRSPSDTSKS